MRVLVFSDSHSGISFMRKAIRDVKPDAVIHLGDYYEDATAMAEEFSDIVYHQVPGNCDRFRCIPNAPEMLCYPIGGVMLFMTHGHNQQVKSSLCGLLRAAREYGAAAALYGHTHIPDCHQEEDGLWVLNPGTCSSLGGSGGLLELEDGKIKTCRLFRAADLEEFK